MYKFKRPDNLSFPHVYCTFMAKDKNSDNLVQYRIQDLPEEYYEETVAFMIKNFLPDETLCSSRDVANKPNAAKEFGNFWRETLKQKLSICCFKNIDDELVGVNIFQVNSKDDPKNKMTVR